MKLGYLMSILGKKLFYTFSHVINPKSLNLTPLVAVGRIRTSRHFCFCPYSRQTDWTRHGSWPVGSITVSVGCISDLHPLNKIWSAWVEPLTLAGSWSPSSLLMNLGRSQWLLFFHDHLLLDHSRVEVIGLLRLVVRRNLVRADGAFGPLLDSLRIAVEAC